MRFYYGIGVCAGLAWMLASCGDQTGQPAGGSGGGGAEASGGGPVGTTSVTSTGSGTVNETPRYRADVTPVTSVEQAQPGVFIPPFVDCRDPLPGEAGTGPNGKVCTNVSIAGCTEEGKSFAAYASCEVVKTQRPFWPKPAAGATDPNDPRLEDQAFMNELAWVTKQVESSACVCCHDSSLSNGKAGVWDIRKEAIWTDTVPDSGLALFAGIADSSVLGAYPADQNHGFDRTLVGLPSTDPARMRAFFVAELARRGITEEQAKLVPPFGGPIYANMIAEPTVCDASEGVLPDGTVGWWGGSARYLYVMEEKSKNPGVPPNLDLPEGTIWRLDVLASANPIESGLRYGSTPEGTFQSFPEKTPTARLTKGQKYHFVALRDVGIMMSNCIFTYAGE